jgi:hypothetical protein
VAGRHNPATPKKYNTLDVMVMKQRTQATQLSKRRDDDKCARQTTEFAGIKVTVHIPQNIQDTIRQTKINTIYDILTRKISL